MDFYVLGALGVGDGVHRAVAPRGMPSTVFAMLLLRFNQPVKPGALIAALWSDSQPVSASANLRQYISRIRKFLHGFSPHAASRLQLTYGGYLLQLQRHELDLARFEDLAEAGRQAFDRGDFPAASQHLESAMRLWRGEICQGAAFDPAFEATLRYWEERRFEASRLLLQTRLSLGQYERAIAEIQPLVASDPFCEELWATLMVALYRSHRRGEALEVFRSAHRRFVSELGIEPSARLQHLHQSMLKDDCVPEHLAVRTSAS